MSRWNTVYLTCARCDEEEIKDILGKEYDAWEEDDYVVTLELEDVCYGGLEVRDALRNSGIPLIMERGEDGDYDPGKWACLGQESAEVYVLDGDVVVVMDPVTRLPREDDLASAVAFFELEARIMDAMKQRLAVEAVPAVEAGKE